MAVEKKVYVLITDKGVLSGICFKIIGMAGKKERECEYMHTGIN